MYDKLLKSETNNIKQHMQKIGLDDLFMKHVVSVLQVLTTAYCELNGSYLEKRTPPILEYPSPIFKQTKIWMVTQKNSFCCIYFTSIS